MERWSGHFRRLRRINARKIVESALVLGVPLLRLVDDARQLLDRIDIM